MLKNVVYVSQQQSYELLLGVDVNDPQQPYIFEPYTGPPVADVKGGKNYGNTNGKADLVSHGGLR